MNGRPGARRAPATLSRRRGCLSNALRLETYIQDAETDGDWELAESFRRTQHESKRGADQEKQPCAVASAGRA